jgi:hypothetical protein
VAAAAVKVADQAVPEGPAADQEAPVGRVGRAAVSAVGPAAQAGPEAVRPTATQFDHNVPIARHPNECRARRAATVSWRVLRPC